MSHTVQYSDNLDCIFNKVIFPPLLSPLFSALSLAVTPAFSVLSLSSGHVSLSPLYVKWSRSPFLFSEFNSSVMLVNSQLVFLPPVGIFNHVMFIWIICFIIWFHWPWKASLGEWSIKVVLYLNFFFFLQNNSVEQFWYHVKGLCTLTSKMSFSSSRAMIVNE